jgi:hypothetical protein
VALVSTPTVEQGGPYIKKSSTVPRGDDDYLVPGVGPGEWTRSYGQTVEGTDLATEVNAVSRYGNSAESEYSGRGIIAEANLDRYAAQAAQEQAAQAAAMRANGASAEATGDANLDYVRIVAGGLAGRGNSYASRAISQYGSLASGNSAANARARADQMSALGRLDALAQQAQGPSVAQAQLAQSRDAQMAQSVALARSGRGTSDAAALRAAQFQNAAAQQQYAQQASVLRAQEDLAYRAQQIEATNAAAQGYGAVRSSDLGAMTANLGAEGQLGSLGLGYQQSALSAQQAAISAQQEGQKLGATYAALGQGYDQLGVQTSSGYRQLGAAQSLAYEGLGANAQQYAMGLRNQMFANQMQTNAGLQNTQMQTAAQQNIANQQASAQQNAALIGAAGTVIGGTIGAMTSGPAGAAAGAAAGGAAGTAIGSDERIKTGIRPAEGDVDEAFRFLKSQAYRYRDPTQPGAAPGTHYGPMAQDLARTPAGRSTVLGTPRGMAVDTGRLALLNASETARQRGQIDTIMRRLDSLAGG